MATKPTAVLFAGLSAVLLLGAPVSAGEPAADDATLALPDQPADDDMLEQQSATAPATAVDTDGVLRPSATVPTSMSVAMPPSGGTNIVNTSTSAIATSTLNATISGNGL
jgi:hypothetical protein